jgi:hypothetical protein
MSLVVGEHVEARILVFPEESVLRKPPLNAVRQTLVPLTAGDPLRSLIKAITPRTSSLEAEADPPEVETVIVQPDPVPDPELLELPVLEVQEKVPDRATIQSISIRLFI